MLSPCRELAFSSLAEFALQRYQNVPTLQFSHQATATTTSTGQSTDDSILLALREDDLASVRHDWCYVTTIMITRHSIAECCMWNNTTVGKW